MTFSTSSFLFVTKFPPPIQQQACTSFGIPFAAEALSVSLNIPCHIQLLMTSAFPKSSLPTQTVILYFI